MNLTITNGVTNKQATVSSLYTCGNVAIINVDELENAFNITCVEFLEFMDEVEICLAKNNMYGVDEHGTQYKLIPEV